MRLSAADIHAVRRDSLSHVPLNEFGHEVVTDADPFDRCDLAQLTATDPAEAATAEAAGNAAASELAAAFRIRVAAAIAPSAAAAQTLSTTAKPPPTPRPGRFATVTQQNAIAAALASEQQCSAAHAAAVTALRALCAEAVAAATTAVRARAVAEGEARAQRRRA